MMDSNAFKVTGIDAAQEEAKAKNCRRLIPLTLLENEHTHVKLENASVPLLHRVGVGEHAKWRCAGARADGPWDPREPDELARPHTRLVAGNDAPLIGDRAATRGRSAAEGGDERVGVRRPLPCSSTSLANRNGGNLARLAATRSSEARTPKPVTAPDRL
jgi:hypothetical protein